MLLLNSLRTKKRPASIHSTALVRLFSSIWNVCLFWATSRLQRQLVACRKGSASWSPTFCKTFLSRGQNIRRTCLFTQARTSRVSKSLYPGFLRTCSNLETAGNDRTAKRITLLASTCPSLSFRFCLWIHSRFNRDEDLPRRLWIMTAPGTDDSLRSTVERLAARELIEEIEA